MLRRSRRRARNVLFVETVRRAWRVVVQLRSHGPPTAHQRSQRTPGFITHPLARPSYLCDPRHLPRFRATGFVVSHKKHPLIPVPQRSRPNQVGGWICAAARFMTTVTGTQSDLFAWAQDLERETSASPRSTLNGCATAGISCSRPTRPRASTRPSTSRSMRPRRARPTRRSRRSGCWLLVAGCLRS